MLGVGLPCSVVERPAGVLHGVSLPARLAPCPSPAAICLWLLPALRPGHVTARPLLKSPPASHARQLVIASTHLPVCVQEADTLRQRVIRLLTNTTVVLALGFALGLILGPTVARALEPLTLPALGLLITLAASEVSKHGFRKPRRVLAATGLALLASYVVSSGAILLAARLITPEPQLYTGYVLVAAAPPAASALAFCISLQGDVALSLIGTVGAYLASIIIAPLFTLVFAGSGLVRPQQVFTTLLTLIVIPLAISRILRNRRLLPAVRRVREPLIAWSFALVIFVVVGVNRDVFFREPLLVLRIAVVALLSTFVIGDLVDWGLRRWGVHRRRRVSLILLSSLKNSGFAAAVALALVSQLAALPGAVMSVVEALYILWLGAQVGRMTHEDD